MPIISSVDDKFYLLFKFKFIDTPSIFMMFRSSMGYFSDKDDGVNSRYKIAMVKDLLECFQSLFCLLVEDCSEVSV